MVADSIDLGFLATAAFIQGAKCLSDAGHPQGVKCLAKEDWPRFRHTNYIALAPEIAKKISLRLECIQRGRSDDWLMYSLIDSNSERIALGEIPPGESVVTSFIPKQSGLYVYEISSGLNLATIRIEGAPWAIVTLERPRLHTVKEIERLYFYVPMGLKDFNIFVNTTITGEGLTIKIFSPAGMAVHEEEVDYERAKRIEIEVPEGADGKAWGLSILQPDSPGLTLDDANLYLGTEVAPYLAKKPEWALLFGRRRYP